MNGGFWSALANGDWSAAWASLLHAKVLLLGMMNSARSSPMATRIIESIVIALLTATATTVANYTILVAKFEERIQFAREERARIEGRTEKGDEALRNRLDRIETTGREIDRNTLSQLAVITSRLAAIEAKLDSDRRKR